MTKDNGHGAHHQGRHYSQHQTGFDAAFAYQHDITIPRVGQGPPYIPLISYICIFTPPAAAANISRVTGGML
jgi:hypothetical protein